MKIIVADDNANERMLFKAGLEENNYTVSEASDGDALLELLKQDGMPDLMVLDIKMPGKNGLELLEEIKHIDERLPILIVTGFSEMKDDFSIWKSPNVIDVFIKPCDMDELLERVSDILGE